MNCKIYIPHIYGDCVDGFEYEGNDVIDSRKYIGMLESDMIEKRHTFNSISRGGFGTLNSFNPNRRDVKVKPVSVLYNNCQCVILNDEGDPIEYEELLWNAQYKKKFAVTLVLKNLISVVGNEIVTDLKRFLTESANVLEKSDMVMAEKLFHLPKIDFKTEFEEKGTTAILKDCKIVDPIALNKFSIIVNEIKFLNKR